jgi:hydroxymethylpyrimidine/phosphomethylpyrimidine kinase
VQKRPSLLIAGGLDPLGGAGITADATLASVLGLAPLPVALALVEQDSHDVRRLWPIALEHVAGSFRAALEDGRPAVVKVGVIGSTEAAEWMIGTILPWLRSVPERRLVLDPVLRGGTAHGAPLAPEAMLPLLRALATPQTILTPNAAELAKLSAAVSPRTHAEAVELALSLHRETGAAVLMKSGHTDCPGQDAWVADGAVTMLPAHPRWSLDLHGTGCFLATALACGIARGRPPLQAAAEASAMLARLVAGGGVAQVGEGRPQLLHAMARW